MHFKQIELTGFKSFAERTVIRLESGVTAVVGPNGCGKSNILDAMRWALGEQKPKSLRGVHMQDIIFNGSEERAPMGMAEVTLTFDNSDGTLPIDFSEVQITRRLYRSGESEYLINRAPCLLRDVHELFMDTGIGTNAYSMIGQGKIGMVLSSKPENRRFLFEEAAGIIKYKTRKRVALRKLDQAEQNLLRLGDIVGEVQRQTRSLKRQVNAAKRHRELSEQLRALEIRGSWLKQRELKAQIAGLHEQFSQAQAAYEEKGAKMSGLEARHEELSLGKLEIDRVLHARREGVHEIGVEMEKIERQIALIRQQIQFSIEQHDRTAADRESTIQRADGLHLQQQEAAATGEALRLEQAQIETALDTEQARSARVDEAVAETDARLEALRVKSVEAMTTRANGQSALEALTVNLRNAEDQLHALGLRRKEDYARAEEASALLGTKRHFESDRAAALAALRSEIAEARQVEERRARDLDVANRHWQELRESRSRVEARLTSLRELRDSYDGFVSGVRAIMQAQQTGRPEVSGVIGPLGDLVSAGPEYARAVDAALGGAVNQVVVEGAAHARAAIRFLNEERAGRVTFLPLDVIGRRGPGRHDTLAGEPGVIGPLLDVLEYEGRLRPVMECLFDDTVLVRGMDDATRIVDRLHDRPRIVTLDGEIVEPGGAITGGRTASDARGIVGRRAEIAELETELAAIDGRVREASGRVEALESARDEFGRRLEQMSVQRDAHQQEVAEVALEITQFNTELERLAQVAEGIAREQELLRERQGEFENARRERLARAVVLEREEGEIAEEIAAAREDASVARRDQSERSARLADLRVQSARLAKSVDETERDCARYRADCDSAREEAEARGRAMEEFRANHAALDIETENSIERSRGLAESKEEARKGVVEAENRRQKLLDESDAIEKQLKTVRDQVREYQGTVHKTELELHHDEDQLSFFQERIQSEYGVALGALTEDEVGADDHDEKTRDELVGQIRERLDRMGPVNLMAIEEYEALIERHDFLVAQEQDLQEARQTLLNVVERIDNTIRDMFLDTFNSVAENFREYFRRLFSGGQARIYLIDEDDPLESGIEIEARPPGKKPQTISLLSGGEQALTAIALLFAIFKAKPSPFCVLDEVDAPLDDANIGRFVSLVDEFCVDTQFVVITHNKQTMARADALYGITQQERGVSQIVSVRFDDIRETESAA